jgi:hypothetical protein
MSRNAYDKKEFLASTDERFRPVNMYNAPDGTMYLIDMYRGLIQHGAFITPYLRKDTLERGLEKPIGLGRIFRIVHETTQPRKPPALADASSAELIKYLSSPNGWHRDLAQQLLVSHNDLSIVPQIRKLAASGDAPLGRLHAVWVLEGLNKIDPTTLIAALADKDADVRASAVALSKPLAIKLGDSPLLEALTALSADPDKNIRLQLAFTLGLVNTASADGALEPILKDASADPIILEALLAGFVGHEAEFIAWRIALPRWEKPEPWRQQLRFEGSQRKD